ncbi:MAG: WecB/TagA/CpsF family glycosyltransferase [Deltaproteobacteria bacterium]|nr:WecB/TagA/CpsF family glycosyltransferase [Deltaproteobacteria bacterium]
MPAATATHSATSAEHRITLLGIDIDNVTMAEAIDEVMARLEAGLRTRLLFVNADCVNISFRDAAYREILRAGDLVLADGLGMWLAGKIRGATVRDNVNGTDLFPRLCGRLAGTPFRVFLLGARPGVAEDVRTWIARHHPEVVVCGVRDGYFPLEQSPQVAATIREARTDVLLVAMGAPRQEAWIDGNLEATGATVAMGVGGLFDFYSGQIPRAPRWMRDWGLEWVYRFAREPRRMWKRYWVGNFVFMWRVICHRPLKDRPAEASST